MIEDDVQATAASGRIPFNLRLLATSDLHGHLNAYDYLRAKEDPSRGLTLLASLVEEFRRPGIPTLLFDNGDTFEGTPMAEFSATGQLGGSEGEPHPMIAAMNVMGYDAATLGNHDFNFGIAPLAKTLSTADFPILLSNIRQNDGRQLWRRSCLIERQVILPGGHTRNVKIGVLGVAPPQLVEWDGAHLRGSLSAEPIVESVVIEADRLRYVSGAEIVILLAHSGFESEQNGGAAENAILPLIETSAVDVIVAGHSHELFPSQDSATPYAVPVVQPGAYASHLGVIDLCLAENDDGDVIVEDHDAYVVPAVQAMPAPHLVALSTGAHEATTALLGRSAGQSAIHISSYFTRLAPCPAIHVIAEAQLAAGRRLIDGHPSARLPMLSAAAPTRTGGPDGRGNYTDIAAGPLKYRHSFDLYNYPNRLVILQMQGAAVRQWLEHAALAFRTVLPSRNKQWLINRHVPGYNYDVIYGLTYEIDVTSPSIADQPEGPGRIRNLCFNGRSVDDDEHFTVVTNSYRYGGGGGFEAASSAVAILVTDLFIREIVLEYLRRSAVVADEPTQIWKFSNAGGIPVIAETGGGALQHLEYAERFGLKALAAEPSAEGGLAYFEASI